VLLGRARDRRLGYLRRNRESGRSADPLTFEELGAGEGNRTLVFSLEGCCSTIELHPRRLSAPRSDTARLKAPFLAIRAREVNSRKGSALCVCNAFMTLGTELPAGRITKARASGPETGITISLRKGATTYTLFHLNDGYIADAVCPRGTGLVNPSTFPSLGPQPIPFQVGTLIGDNGYDMFTAFPSPAGNAYSIAEDSIGLKFQLSGGVHSWYVTTAGTRGDSLRYEDEPNARHGPCLSWD
jgi:hypothetical protein